MGIREAEAAMSRLESAQCPFDYKKVDHYRSKIQDFVERNNSMFPEQPLFFDMSFGKTRLPASLSDRLEKWMSTHPVLT